MFLQGSQVFSISLGRSESASSGAVLGLRKHSIKKDVSIVQCLRAAQQLPLLPISPLFMASAQKLLLNGEKQKLKSTIKLDALRLIGARKGFSFGLFKSEGSEVRQHSLKKQSFFL